MPHGVWEPSTLTSTALPALPPTCLLKTPSVRSRVMAKAGYVRPTGLLEVDVENIQRVGWALPHLRFAD